MAGGRLPDNYLGPKHRITMLKKDHLNSAITTEVTHTVIGETLCLTVKASILIDDRTVATGHAFTDSPEENKALEKAETIAIGRALVNAGYPETTDDLPETEEEERPAKKQEKKEEPKRGLGLGGGLGKKKAEPAPVTEESAEEESEDDDEEEEAAEEEVEAPKAKAAEPAAKPKHDRDALLAKYGAKK